MDALSSLLYGFSVSLTPANLMYCALGVFLGTIVGVLPGIGPLGGITILLPTTFGMEPVSAIIMLAGIYYGAMYGGSTTSILVNIPGEAASVVTCFDGYQMARKGRAGPALSIAAAGSYIAGTLSVLGLMLLAPALARFALKFGPPEQFSLMVLGLVILAYVIGILPGAAHIISTFVSYAMEKRLSKHPEEFGTGRIEGVAGPESANNAATGGAMIPFLALGIPSAPATATMMVALLIHGVKPGPMLMEQHPEVFWGLIASMYIGNVMLLVLNLPLVGLFINLLRVPQHLLFPGILLVCFVGVYSVNLSATDLWIMGIAGVVGYLLRKVGFDPAPIVLAMVLGPMMEQALRQGLMMSRGEFGIFLNRPISVVMLGAAALILVFHVISVLRQAHARSAAGLQERSASV